VSPSHPNRARGAVSPGRNPDPAEIRQAREEAELTQTQAARMIYATMRIWQDWEAGVRRMPSDRWEYWCLLISCRAVRQARLEQFGNPTDGAPLL